MFDDPSSMIAAAIVLVCIAFACVMACMHKPGDGESGAGGGATHKASTPAAPRISTSSSRNDTAHKSEIPSFFEQSLETTFHAIDTNGSGTVSFVELKTRLKAGGLFHDEIQSLFDAADTNKDGSLTLAEFLAAVAKVPDLADAIKATAPSSAPGHSRVAP